MLRTILVLLALCAATLARAADDTASTAPLHLLTFSGDQSALAALDREIQEAGKDTAKLTTIETRLLATLRRSEITFAARQAICQRLGLLLAQTPPKSGADAYKPLGTMLADDRDSDLARLALQPAPGAVIDAMFVNALGKTKGRTRLGIIGALGQRRTDSAVSALAGLLKDSDQATAAAAARALGEIGNTAAAAALRGAPAAVGAAVTHAKLAAARRLPAREASALLRDVQTDTRAPAHLRAASFRSSLSIEPATAANRIAETLTGNNAAFKQVALEAIADVAASNLVGTLAPKLSSWDAATQAAVISAFGRRGDAGAVPAVSAALTHTNREVRAAAIGALGALPGNRDIAASLARIAAGESSDDAKLARQSLARLNGRDVSAAILAGAEHGDASLRAVYLEQLALRNMIEGLPLLLKCRADPDVTIRTAAVAALGDLAPASEQPALLDWAVGATDEGEQSRALRSLVNVILRDPNTDTRGGLLFDALEKSTPEVTLRLLPALSRIGNKASAESAARIALRADATLSDAAIAALGRWTDRTALPSLATVAEKAARPASRTAALQAALRYFERNREPWSAETTDVVSRLLPATKDAESRRKLVTLLHRANNKRALEFAESLQSDAAIGDRARHAAAVIRANLAGPPTLRASGAPSNVKNMLDGKTSTRWNVATNGDEWVEIDFKVTRPLQKITLDQTGRTSDFPERYEVFVTDDLKNPGAAVVTGKGQRTRTVIELPAGTSGRYVVVKNTDERADGQWAISELWVD